MSKELLMERIRRFGLQDQGVEILLALDGFIVNEPLNVRQLKMHAKLMKNTLSTKGIVVKTTQSQELVASFHGFKDWRNAVDQLGSSES
ncbi:TPA: glyoxalase superfamily protein [Salmonella enterica]|uniref:Glyoxalase-related protein domain-containing protein n=1 Tax=Salmonella enterica subsp. enterica serovar Bareilly TaxID=58096 RepID=A0A637Y0I6_SALET|nr:glyoxalase superfamily protein [Salmonella enterica]ECH8273273.1 hypothetical protein [Salmonella enterica subsp. enterica]ECV0358354.1 hypothetical protein [Salmonella enterica subsp. enterica serovar Bareilly]EAQ9032228.1 hypothetical protein [Salmonella enterica]EAR7716696.1 hypothetical protein [Salmonella enterica]EAW3312366.1 hypothetical protein [Salmonella enterica]